MGGQGQGLTHASSYRVWEMPRPTTCSNPQLPHLGTAVLWWGREEEDARAPLA